MRVMCEVEVIELDGNSERSVRRAMIMLRDECPQGENNFYVADQGDD